MKVAKSNKKQIQFKDARGELDEVLHKERNLEIEEKPLAIQEKLISNERHEREDHYHGVHHFDKYGHHDDIKPSEFTIKTQFPKSKQALTFRITMAGLVLGLSVVASLIDMAYNKAMPNFGGVPMDIRILDLLVIICGLPIVGLWGSIGISCIEPWIHMAIDSDHTPAQIGFDCICYSLACVMFFFIYYIAFKNSPIHKEPDRRKRWFKRIVPGIIIIPTLAVLFTLSFALALYVNYKSFNEAKSWTKFVDGAYWIIFAELGVQALRFLVMYIFFILLEPTMKPINHRYR